MYKTYNLYMKLFVQLIQVENYHQSHILALVYHLQQYWHKQIILYFVWTF